VSASNTGQTHQQVSDFTLRFAGSEATARGVVSRYVLPGSTVIWKIAPPAGVAQGSATSIHGASDQGDFQADVALAGP
jgi:P pilus assembly chaperone PapD